jgi:hypothetical protein
VSTSFVLFSCLISCILSDVYVCRLMVYSFFAKMGHPDVQWSVVSSCSLHGRYLLTISCFTFLLLKVVCAECLILSRH